MPLRFQPPRGSGVFLSSSSRGPAGGDITDPVRYDTTQSLTSGQKTKARDNIGLGTADTAAFEALNLTGPLSINPGTEAERMIYIQQQGSGIPERNSVAAGLTGGGFDWNSIKLVDTGIDAYTDFPGGSRNAAILTMAGLYYGGMGTKDGLHVSMKTVTAPDASDQNEYVGVRSNVLVHNDVNFTSALSAFAAGFDVGANAIDMVNVCGMEISSSILSGGSAGGRSGIAIVGAGGTGSVRGTNRDAALSISVLNRGGTSAKWGHGVLFSAYNGSVPFDSTSIAIGATDAMSIGTVMDFSTSTISNYIFKFSGFQVLPGGFMGINNVADVNIPLIVRAAPSNRYASRMLIDNADAAAGPLLELYRTSASPANNDLLGALIFTGYDAGAGYTEYARVGASIADTTDTSEDGNLDLYVMRAGTLTKMAHLGAQGVVVDVGDVIAPAGNGYFVNGRGGWRATSDGVILLHNNAVSDFTRLLFGKTDNTRPALKVSGTTLEVKLADDSAYAPLAVGGLVLPAEPIFTAQSSGNNVFQVYNPNSSAYSAIGFNGSVDGREKMAFGFGNPGGGGFANRSYWEISGFSNSSTYPDGFPDGPAHEGVILQTGSYISATATGTVGAPTTTLTVTGVVGTVRVNAFVFGTGVPNYTRVVSQISGTTGGDGDYELDKAITSSGASITFKQSTGHVRAIFRGAEDPHFELWGVPTTGVGPVHFQVQGKNPRMSVGSATKSDEASALSTLNVLDAGTAWSRWKTGTVILDMIRATSPARVSFQDTTNSKIPLDLYLDGTGKIGVGGPILMTEQTAPSAPSANQVLIYAQDNGSGKTQLMALFSSGAAQQIAIQP